MSLNNNFELRSQRLKVHNPNDVYIYDEFPIKLKEQIIHVLVDCVSDQDMWDDLHDRYCREAGFSNLPDYHYQSTDNVIFNFFRKASISDSLDILELSLKYVLVHQHRVPDYYQVRMSLEDGIKEINYRFKKAAFGYEIVSFEIIQIDSQHIHKEIVKPVLHLISDPRFEGVQDEYHKAFEHYRHKSYEASISESNKAFESTMKSICEIKGYPYSKDKDTASRLINILFDNGYIPGYMKNSFASLKTILSSSLPTVRNKNAGHGQGQDIITVSESYARYALNLAACNIRFLVDQL